MQSYYIVPTIQDRVWQCLVKYAIEPAHEATFHANSYGFRPSRSAFDAAKHLFTLLRSNSNGYKKLVLELDIEKCFDRINHTQLIKKVIAPSNIKTGLWKCLKAGNNIDLVEQGTAQGGVISPLLANIAINGIEKIGETRCPKRYHKVTSCIRYADDMVFALRPDIPEHSPELIRAQIDEFLALRGLNVKESKTHLKASTDGFTFLGWDFIVLPNHKLKIFPSKEGYEAMRNKVKK
ncbi:MAG: reverse transcriptase domain-containing protein, partial [Cyanobacteria bacterium J06632_19]